MNRTAIWDYLENTFLRNFRGFDPLVEFPLSNTISHITSCNTPQSLMQSAQNTEEWEKRDGDRLPECKI